MNRLQPLRARLNSVGRRRWWAQAVVIAARVTTAIVCALLVLFVLDVGWRPSIPVRAVFLTLAAGVVGWYLIRRSAIAPDRETLIDWALDLERRHRLDGDLVAALQFDAHGSRQGGSMQLRQAVVERAAALADGLDYHTAISWVAARQSAGRALGLVLLAGAVGVSLPEHVRVFARRLLLGAASYPTQTRIVDVAVNGSDVLDSGGRSSSTAAAVATAAIVERTAAAFSIHAEGKLPAAGELRVSGLTTAETLRLPLQRVISETQRQAANTTAEYRTTTPLLHEPVTYSIRLGDAAVVQGRIDLLRPPLVELTVEVVPPDYARHQLPLVQHATTQVQALEGSTVNLLLRSVNRKRLTAVTATRLDDAPAGPNEFHFQPIDQERLTWRLEGLASGERREQGEAKFEVNVVDEDGLSPAPLQGTIQWRSDESPAATLATAHQVIVARAQPTFACIVQDDFAIGELVLHATRLREGETPQEAALAPRKQSAVPLPQRPQPVTSEPLRLTWRLDTEGLHLAEGDRLMVTLEVFDYRGAWPGVGTRSEPVELPVVNEATVLKTILDGDAEAERLLTEAIEQELGVTGAR